MGQSLPKDTGSSVLLASRKPVFDRLQRVWAYELNLISPSGQPLSWLEALRSGDGQEDQDLFLSLTGNRRALIKMSTGEILSGGRGQDARQLAGLGPGRPGRAQSQAGRRLEGRPRGRPRGGAPGRSGPLRSQPGFPGRYPGGRLPKDRPQGAQGTGPGNLGHGCARGQPPTSSSWPRRWATATSGASSTPGPRPTSRTNRFPGSGSTSSGSSRRFTALR